MIEKIYKLINWKESLTLRIILKKSAFVKQKKFVFEKKCDDAEDRHPMSETTNLSNSHFSLTNRTFPKYPQSST